MARSSLLAVALVVALLRGVPAAGSPGSQHGGTTARLTNDTHLYADPVFSPDGTHLAYVSSRPNGYFNVYIRPIRDGRFAGEEIAVTRDHGFGRDRPYMGAWDMHLEPAWMPG